MLFRHGAAEQHQLPDREALPREVPWRASSVRQRGRSLSAIALHTMARGAIDVPRVLADLAFAVPLLSALLASSLLVWPRWIPEWLGVMFGYRQYSTPPLVWYLLGNQAGSRLGPILIATLLASALALASRMRSEERRVGKEC